MPSMHAPPIREELVARLRRIAPESAPLWGRMTAPQMVAHLSDQMRHTLGDVPVEPRGGPLSWAPVRWLSIYVVPWPRGKVKGPSEAFVSQPTDWDADVDALAALVARFGERAIDASWPQHILFGRMSGEDWGAFCYKHFDHHLRQFGV